MTTGSSRDDVRPCVCPEANHGPKELLRHSILMLPWFSFLAVTRVRCPRRVAAPAPIADSKTSQGQGDTPGSGSAAVPSFWGPGPPSVGALRRREARPALDRVGVMDCLKARQCRLSVIEGANEPRRERGQLALTGSDLLGRERHGSVRPVNGIMGDMIES